MTEPADLPKIEPGLYDDFWDVFAPVQDLGNSVQNSGLRNLSNYRRGAYKPAPEGRNE